MSNLLEEIVKRMHQGANTVGQQVQSLPQQFQATGQLIKQGAPQAAQSAYNAYSKATPMIPFSPQIPTRQGLQQASQRQVQVGQAMQRVPQIQGPVGLGGAAYNFGIAGPAQSYGRSLERLGQGKLFQGDIMGNIEDTANLAFNPVASRVAMPVIKAGGNLAVKGAKAAGQTGKIQLGPVLKQIEQPGILGQSGKPPMQFVQQNPKNLQEFLPGEQGMPQNKPLSQGLSQSPQPPLQSETSQTVRSFDDIISKTATDVKEKVNLLDKFRSPDRVFKKIGLEKEYDLVRKQYDKYVKELPEEINKVTEWSKRVGPESNQRIFKFLDGQKIELQGEELKVASEIKTYLAGWADKLGLPKHSRITNYITHIFDKDFIKKEFDEDLAKLIQDRIPGSVYDPFTLERLGKLGYKEDTWQALDAYVKRGVRKYNMDPALERVKRSADRLELSQFNYVKDRIERINLRPSDLDNSLDNFIKSTPIGYKLGQRPTMTLNRGARQMVYRATLGLNPSSALKNLTQGANTYSKLGEKYTILGYAKAAKAIATRSDELERVGVLNQDILQDRGLNATKKTLEKIDKGLFVFFNAAEKINRGAAYFGAKAKGLSQGMDEEQAIEYAKKIVRDTQFTFGSIDTPQILSSDIGKTLGQFQSYTLKQTEFIGEMIKNKDIKGMLRFAGANVVLYMTLGKLLGLKPQDMLPSARFDVPATLKLPTEIGKAALNTPDKYGNERDLGQKMGDIGEAALLYVPGSTQAKKTIEGIGAYQQGASITPGGKTRFEVDQTPENLAKSAILGQYSLPGAKEYFDNMGKSKSEIIHNQFSKLKTNEEKAALWSQMVKDGKINKSNIGDITKYANDQKLGITPKDRKIRQMGVEDGTRAEAIVKEFSKLKTNEEKAKLWEKYTKAKVITPEISKQMRYLLQKQ